MPNDTAATLVLLFEAVKDQARMLDERCTDPALTSFILAIDALAQRGFEQASTAADGGKP